MLATANAANGASSSSAAAAAAGVDGAAALDGAGGNGDGSGSTGPARQQAGWQGDGGAVVARRSALPLIRLSMCQALDLPAAPQRAPPPPRRRRPGRGGGLGGASGSGGASWESEGQGGVERGMVRVESAGDLAAEGSAAAVVKAAIVSFRKVELQLGALDFETDQVGGWVTRGWCGAAMTAAQIV